MNIDSSSVVCIVAIAGVVVVAIVFLIGKTRGRRVRIKTRWGIFEVTDTDARK